MENLIEIQATENLSKRLEKMLGPLPKNVQAGSIVCYPENTNIFINDAKVNSLEFLGRLRTPLGIIGANCEQRNVEIWEEDYLSAKLADLLVLNSCDLRERVVVPMNGCGEVVARGLVSRLFNDYQIDIPIVTAEEAGERPAIIVDDVLKTGTTILRELPQDFLQKPNNIFAVWAMSRLSQKDYSKGERYGPLRLLTNGGQQILAGIVYAGAGLASPGLGLPVNSISTLLGGDSKADEVLKSLAQKYFGDAIYRAAGTEV